MKKVMVMIGLAVAMASCNNADNEKKDAVVTEVKTEPAAEVKLPIPLVKPYRNWQWGSTENVVAAMGALKAYVDKDFTAMGAIVGDSIDVRFDYYQAKLAHDSAIKMFTADRTKYNDLVITMYDYESVISADKKDEWVTLWYKQSWKNEKGKADSLSIIDDCKIKNGKLVELDEKIQHFPMNK